MIPKNILLRIAHGQDIEAFRWLVEKYSRQLFSYAIVFVKKEELAEEIVSDVWLKIWHAREQLPKIESLSSYLFIVTKNQSLTYINSRQLRQERDLISIEHTVVQEPLIEQTPHTDLEREELKRTLDSVLSQLPENSQRAFRMVKEEGLSYQEAASKMDITINTLKTHLRRAIKKLRLQLREEFSDLISM